MKQHGGFAPKSSVLYSCKRILTMGIVHYWSTFPCPSIFFLFPEKATTKSKMVIKRLTLLDWPQGNPKKQRVGSWRAGCMWPSSWLCSGTAMFLIQGMGHSSWDLAKCHSLLTLLVPLLCPCTNSRRSTPLHLGTSPCQRNP